MHKLNKIISAVALASVGSVANAGFFQLDTSNSALYDGVNTAATPCTPALVLAIPGLCPNLAASIPGQSANGTGDADSRTGQFTEFGFSQLLATSVYALDVSDPLNPTLTGDFYDTNIVSELNALGIDSTDASATTLKGKALDTVTDVAIVLPLIAQTDIDALSPLVPPINNTDNEGFLSSWDLQVEYHLDGTISGGAPQYTGGNFTVMFNDFNDDSNDRTVFEGTITGSSITAANLDLFMDITSAEPGFLWFGDNGSFVDVSTYPITSPFKLTLDTNVNPPIPTPDQLIATADGNGGFVAVRQSTLDGSIGPSEIPEPASLAIFGLGLLGLAGASRRKTK
ncbi:MAG: hypothetical protein ACJAXJ_000050 [Colwellia sp.]|jgi:hypothetical protein